MRSVEQILKDFSKLRKLRKLKIEDVQEHLSKEGISISTKSIYSWENGSTKPSIQIFVLLCQFYKIENIYDLFSIGISLEDAELIERYHKTDKKYLPAIDRLLEDIYIS